MTDPARPGPVTATVRDAGTSAPRAGVGDGTTTVAAPPVALRLRRPLVIGRDPGRHGLSIGADDETVAARAIEVRLVGDAVVVRNVSAAGRVEIDGGRGVLVLDPGEGIRLRRSAELRVLGDGRTHTVHLEVAAPHVQAPAPGAAAPRVPPSVTVPSAVASTASSTAPGEARADRRSSTADAGAGRTLPYLGGLDGLRAVAVVAVIAFHAGLARVRGGYLGVEVFFVVSGYLITLLLLDEHQRTGTVALRAFWARRARRLLPALGALLAGTWVLAQLVATDALDSLRRELVGAVLYVTNWQLILADASYFEGFGRPPLLRHLWSLAIEEQFYLVWPVLLGLGLRRAGRTGAFRLVCGGAVASTVLMAVLFDPGSDPSRVYYGTDTRAAALLIGAALAFLPQPWQRPARPAASTPVVPGGAASAGPAAAGLALPDLAAAAAGALLLTLFAVLDGTSPWLYRGGFLMTSLATVVLIRAAVDPSTRTAGWLGTAPLRAVGMRSYSLYLWHWPVFTVTRDRIDVTIGGLPLLTLQLAATVALAECSYRLVERPVRERRFLAGLVDLGSPASLARAAVPAGSILATGALLVAVQAPPLSVEMAGTDAFLAAGVTVPGGGATTTTVTTTPASAAAPGPGQDGAANGAAAPAGTAPADTSPPSSSAAAEAEASVVEGVAPVTDEPVLAFGDSVLLGASGAVRALAPNAMIDARIGRQWWDAGDEIASLGPPGSFGPVAVVHLGDNGRATESMIDDVLAAIGPARRVVLVTVRVPKPWEGEVNDQIVRAAQRHPNVVVADWHAASNDRRELFAPDGVHLSTEGLAVYRQLLADALS